MTRVATLATLLVILISLSAIRIQVSSLYADDAKPTADEARKQLKNYSSTQFRGYVKEIGVSSQPIFAGKKREVWIVVESTDKKVTSFVIDRDENNADLMLHNVNVAVEKNYEIGVVLKGGIFAEYVALIIP